MTPLLGLAAVPVVVFNNKLKKFNEKRESKQVRLELGWQENVRNSYVQARDLAGAVLAVLN